MGFILNKRKKDKGWGKDKTNSNRVNHNNVATEVEYYDDEKLGSVFETVCLSLLIICFVLEIYQIFCVRGISF